MRDGVSTEIKVLQRDLSENERKILPYIDGKLFEELQRQVMVSKGVVRVWVHPYYMGDDFDYISTMEKTVSALDKGQGVPNIFFMPSGTYFKRDMSRILSIAGNGEDKCYFVPTGLGNPEPELQGENEVGGWEVVREILTKAGVTRCLVGGEYAMLPEIKKPDGDKVSGCVNEAMNQLSVSFHVELSNAAYPVNRSAAVGLGYEVESKN